MHARTVLLALALAASALVTGPTVAGHTGEDAQVTVTAQSGDACPSGDDFCFDVEGDVPVEAGKTVEVTFVVPESEEIQHDLHVADSGYDEGGNSDTSDEIAGVDPVSPGNETTFTFDVPEGADQLYYWCDVAAHETRGMHGLWGEASADGGGEGGNESPGVGVAAALAVLGVGAAVLSRD